MAHREVPLALQGPPARPAVASLLVPERSVIIPVYGRSDLTRQCLDTLLPQDLGDCELIVVDDASPDDTARVLEEYADRSKVVTDDENTGYACACSDGGASARG